MVTQAARSEATRGALVGAGRTLFGERGFAAAPLDEVVRRAGVTKGALYHHFENKEALFRAVFEDVEADLVRTVMTAAGASAAPRDRLRSGVRAFLVACQDPDVQRIVLQDAPAVLGWAAWRAVDDCHFSALLRDGLDAAMTQAGSARPVGLVAPILRGALSEAAQLAGHSTGPEALAQVLDVIDGLLDGLLPSAVPV
jgi:AcrR family transcriptional regulator